MADVGVGVTFAVELVLSPWEVLKTSLVSSSVPPGTYLLETSTPIFTLTRIGSGRVPVRHVTSLVQLSALLESKKASTDITSISFGRF